VNILEGQKLKCQKMYSNEQMQILVLAHTQSLKFQKTSTQTFNPQVKQLEWDRVRLVFFSYFKTIIITIYFL
jgi:hypothetical protein